MKTSWTNGLPAEEKEEMRTAFLSCSRVRNRLIDLLKAKQEERRNKELLESAYANPNWMLVQADAVGFQRALDEVISLLIDK